jgi:glycerophosphoryl diester phosphodiesterase
VEAFAHAVALGADVLDTDMHRTVDGHLVLIHDETVDRTSEGTGAVRDLSLADLRLLDFGYRFTTPDAPDRYPYRGAELQILTVPEFFTIFETMHDNLRYGIEIKQTGPEAATELCELIVGFDVEDRVLVSSFTQPNMDAFRRACPQVATSATANEVRNLYLAHRAGLNGLIRPDFDALQIPERAAGFTLLTEGFIDDAEALGLPVIPWTIDDPEQMRALLDLGVEGINSNRPDLLVDLVL